MERRVALPWWLELMMLPLHLLLAVGALIVLGVGFFAILIRVTVEEFVRGFVWSRDNVVRYFMSRN